MTATPATQPINLSARAKAFVAACFALSALTTAGINGLVTLHFSRVQADETARRDDVKKFETSIGQFDQLVRSYMVSLEAGTPAPDKREAVLANAQEQFESINSLAPLLPEDKQPLARAYQDRLVEIAKNLRDSNDVKSTLPFAQSVSHGIDERIALDNSLRSAAGLPIVSASAAPAASQG